MNTKELFFANANPVSFHYPQLTLRGFRGKHFRQASHDGKQCPFILVRRSKDYNSCVLSRWIRSDICKIQIQRNEDAVFFSTVIEQDGVWATRKSFRVNCLGIIPGRLQILGTLNWQIFVHLELQGFVSSGSSTVPSRASSAA